MRMVTRLVASVAAGCVVVLGSAASGSVQPASAGASQPVPSMEEAQELFRQQKWEDAARVLSQIVREDAENVQAWFQLGYSLHVSGDLEGAIAAHRRVVDLTEAGDRLHALGLYNLGCAYALEGKKDEAFEALMRAAASGFSRGENLRHVAQDSDLDSLRDDPRFAAFVASMRFHGRDEALRRFDFWIGSWDVYNREGRLVGHNTIEAIEGGLALMERWRSVRGFGGSSMNYYDPVGGVWKQVWIDGQSVLEASGRWEDGAMRFAGERKMRDGQVRRHRMVFTPMEGDRVRQRIEESADGEEWVVVFDGLYVRAGSDAPGAWGEASG